MIFQFQAPNLQFQLILNQPVLCGHHPVAGISVKLCC